MRACFTALLLASLCLAGCDKITGEADQKILDAKAIGYSCRVSMKPPQDCIQDNETYSPTYILIGWKEADQDVNERIIDPSMGKRTASASSNATKSATEQNLAKGSDAKITAEQKPAKVTH